MLNPEGELKPFDNAKENREALILVQDQKGSIVMINRFGCTLTGYLECELLEMSFLTLIPVSERLPDLKFHVEDILSAKRKELRHDSAVVRKDGSTVCVSWSHFLLPDSINGHQILSVGLDVSESNRAEERLGWLASHDVLTGLLNRRRFTEELNNCVAQTKRYGQAGAILVFDLDHFKDVNDASGHQIGDELLARVSETLVHEARETDQVFRLGGDEFAIILREVDESAVGGVAKRMCLALSSIVVHGDNRIHRISSSVGVALYPKHGDDADELLANADIALYQAKDSGRNGWHIFLSGEQDKERVHERVYWNEKIKEALAEDLLQVVFQPIMHVKSSTISHYEALLRVYDEENKPLPTYKFILFAEKSGLIQEVDLAIVEKTLRYKQKLENRGIDATIAINLSGVSFRNKELNSSIVTLIEKYSVNPAQIIFEITETAAVEDISQTAIMMKELKKRGCKFALDDFGVGFSSLYHLKQLPLDYVKIDGAFIRRLPDEPEDQVLVKAVVEVSKVFGQQTVAEFVEDERILAELSRLGVDFAQGYHIDKPKSWDELWGENTIKVG